MDFWVVVAAAGAGYVAKHWQKNPLMSRENLSKLSSSESKIVKSQNSPSNWHVRDEACPLRCLARIINKLGEDVCDFDGEAPANVDVDEDRNVLSVAGLPPNFIGGNVDSEGDLEETRVSADMDESSIPGEMSTSYYVTARKESSLRSRRSKLQFVKPLSSLESCLVAQLYNKHADMEEYVLSSVPSPSTPTVRPFLVTDGRKIISRERSNSSSLQNGREEIRLQKGKFPAENETVFGVPPLPISETLDLRRKGKIRYGKGGKSSSPGKTANGKHFHSKAGSCHGALLFCLGISLGIMSSFLGNKREVDKMNELLKQTENFVQDLQEELEMKDSLNVKELSIEDCESCDTRGDSCNKRARHAFSPKQILDESTKRLDGQESQGQKSENHSESISLIEAELEAELERLEINMKSSSLEQKLSDLEELDPEFRPNIIRGELRADMFGHQGPAQPNADRDGSGPSTTHSANHAVSPQELSLRLHELVRSRLEERIKELEIALHNSQKKVQFMESEHTKYFREYSSSEVGSSSIHASPTAKAQSPILQPMVINLSGEALDSYNEAYDEFLKRNDSEEDLPPRCIEINNQEDPGPLDSNWHFMPDHTIIDGKLEERVLSEAATMSGDENESGDDEIETLIKQIVERTKKGSPAILNAQRVLFSLDES